MTQVSNNMTSTHLETFNYGLLFWGSFSILKDYLDI